METTKPTDAQLDQMYEERARKAKASKITTAWMEVCAKHGRPLETAAVLMDAAASGPLSGEARVTIGEIAGVPTPSPETVRMAADMVRSRIEIAAEVAALTTEELFDL